MTTSTSADPPGEIGPDELALLEHLAQGRSLARVGQELHLSPRTVRRRLRSTCDALGVDTPIEAVVWAVRRHKI